MTPEQVSALFGYFGAAWPNAKVDERTPQVWIEQLEPIDADDGREAAKRLVRSCQWFPSVAEFLDVAAEVKAGREPVMQALPARSFSVDRDTNRRMLQACREVVAQAKGRQHYHGTAGPKGAWKDDECPVCAQIPPPYGQVEAGEAF